MSSSHDVIERVIELPANAAAAQLARRELAAIPGVGGAVGYKMLLLTSELISICLEEAANEDHATIWISVQLTDDRVRVEVAGRPPGLTVDDSLHSRETPSLGGYGLQIVDRMADSWGAEGKNASVVWFELAR